MSKVTVLMLGHNIKQTNKIDKLVGFLLLRYSVLFTVESLSLLYLLVIS